MTDISDTVPSSPFEKLAAEVPYNAQVIWEAVREQVNAQPHPTTKRFNGFDGQLWQGILNEIVTALWPGLNTLDSAGIITLRRKLNTFLRNSNNLVCVDRGSYPKSTTLPTWWVSSAWNELVITPGVAPKPFVLASVDMDSFGTRPVEAEPVDEVDQEPVAQEPVAQVNTVMIIHDEDVVKVEVDDNGPDSDGLYPCRKGCGTQISTVTNRKKHESNCDGSPAQYLCPREGCGRRFTGPQGLSTHVANHTAADLLEQGPSEVEKEEREPVLADEPGLFYCGNGCGTLFAKAYKRNRHQATCDGTVATMHCPEPGCRHVYKDTTGLAAHQRSHRHNDAMVDKTTPFMRLHPLSDEEVAEKIVAFVVTGVRAEVPLTLTMIRLVPTGASTDQRRRVLDHLLETGVVREVLCNDSMNRGLQAFVVDVLKECLNCGREISSRSGPGKPAKFCSDYCRKTHHRLSQVAEPTEAPQQSLAQKRRQYVEMLTELLHDYQVLEGNTVALDRALAEKDALTAEKAALQSRFDKAREAFNT